MVKYEGRIFWDGQIPRIESKEKFIEWLKQFPDDSWFNITVEVKGSANTNQKKLYHKWCDILAQEFGWDSGKEMHEYLKDTYNSGQSTKDMDTKQLAEYMTKVSAFASMNNVTLPQGI